MAYRRRNRTRAPRRRNRKRWYVAAKTPFGNFAAGNGKRAFKRAVQEVAEAKVLPTYITNNSLTHSIIKTWNITAQITQGTGNINRIGDKILIHKFMAKLIFDIDCGNLPSYTNEASCRIMVVEMDAEYLGTVNAVLGSGVGSSDVFYNTTVPQWSSIDYRKVKVWCDKTYNFVGQTATSAGLSPSAFYGKREFACTLNKNYTYKGSNAAFGKDKNIYLLVIPFTKGGTSGVTAVFDQLDIDTIITFKDI